MESNMPISLFFIVAFLSLFCTTIMIRKTDRKLLLVQEIIITIITIVCYGALIAAILTALKCPVNILSIGIVYLLTAICIFFWMRKKKTYQHFEWSWFDFVIEVIIVVGVCGLARHFFGAGMNLRYWTSDAAVHVISANAIVLEQSVSSMYFAPLFNALIIEIFQPIYSGIMIYKGFIIADVIMLALELSIFYVVIRPYFRKKSHMIIGMVLVGLYFAGYPLHSFIYTFNYWGIGVLLLGYLLATTQRMLEDEISVRKSTIDLMLGCLGIMTCYMLFAPMAFISVLICMFYYTKKQEKPIFTIKNFLWSIKVFLVPVIVGLYYCYVQFFVNQKLSVGTALNEQGAIYRELYIDFIWFIPFVIYVFIHAIRKKKLQAIHVFFACFGFTTFAMLLLTLKGHMSSYYYYKIYYPLWLFSFVITAYGIFLLLDEAKDYAIGLIALYVAIFTMGGMGIEDRIVNGGTALQMENKSSKIFNLYTTNLAYIKMDWSVYQFNQEYLNLTEYVYDNLNQTDKDVPMIVDGGSYPICYWYMAFTGQKCQDYYGWVNDIAKTQSMIASDKMDYVVLIYGSEYYQSNIEYWNQFDKVYENTAGCIVQVNE